MEGPGENEDRNEVRNNEGEGENQTEATFGFPILDIVLDVNMKNIPLILYPPFMEKVMRTWTHFCSIFISFVGAIIIYKMLTN